MWDETDPKSRFKFRVGSAIHRPQFETRAQSISIWFFLHHRMGNTPKISQLFSAPVSLYLEKTDFDASPLQRRAPLEPHVSSLFIPAHQWRMSAATSPECAHNKRRPARAPFIVIYKFQTSTKTTRLFFTRYRYIDTSRKAIAIRDPPDPRPASHTHTHARARMKPHERTQQRDRRR